jgi:membrane protein DedA with SNARE-associated domain
VIDFWIWWPYAVIFATLFFTGIGLPPLPEEAGIIGAGIAATHDELRWWLVFPACLAGIVAADLVLYGAGRIWRNRLFQYRWFNRFLPPERRQKIEEGFHRNGGKILITARLLPGLRTGIFIVAGAIRFPMIRFLIADALFGVFGVGVLFFGSYFFAEWVKWIVEEIVHRVQYALLFCVVVALIGLAIYRYERYLRTRAATGHYEPPPLSSITTVLSNKPQTQIMPPEANGREFPDRASVSQEDRVSR